MSVELAVTLAVVVAALAVVGWLVWTVLQRARDLGEEVTALQKELAAIGGTVRAGSPALLSSGMDSMRQEQSRLAEGLGVASQSLHQLGADTVTLKQDLAKLSAQAELRTKQGDESKEMLAHLHRVIAGTSHRGAAGENVLDQVLAQLPAGMRQHNVTIANQTVEFAVKLPGGKILPIDSKWTGAEQLERLSQLEDPRAREVQVKLIDDMIAAKAAEVAKYLDPEHTLMLGVAAVPDAAYDLTTRAHARAYDRGVVIIPYSLAVPYVLSVLVLVWRFGHALDTTRLQAQLATIDATLGEMNNTLESHMSRGMTMMQNAFDKHRQGVADCRRSVATIRETQRP